MLYECKDRYCPVCGRLLKVKLSYIYQEPFIVIEKERDCTHNEEILKQFVDLRFSNKLKGLT